MEVSIGGSQVHVPEGALFYPCCGYDTEEPLRLFQGSPVSDFYFVDAEIEPPVPQVILDHGSYTENDLNMYPEKHVHNEEWGSLYLPHTRSVLTLPADENGSIMKIHRYQMDAFIAFQLLVPWKISVFYYVGDSQGRGGSGQWWLGPGLFNQVVYRLAPGGIIITDGSNPHPNFMNAAWNRLWELQHHSYSGREWTTFYHEYRDFRLIGQCGYRYGPVYAWKVQ